MRIHHSPIVKAEAQVIGSSVLTVAWVPTGMNAGDITMAGLVLEQGSSTECPSGNPDPVVAPYRGNTTTE